ncbi:MAG: type II toxin-antitoxin system HicB family antitoxin [Desulfobacteraceae bacterium]|nr:type II toxin-antitoxin system HicB family antitoxin [Desulfobacteraceae bacterium]
MDPEMIRINITLPASVAEELNQYSGTRKRSKFIAEAITMRIRQLEAKKMEALLTEGYQATKNEGLEITKEFETADLENWDEY